MDKWELPGHRLDENCTVLIPLHSPGFWNLHSNNTNNFLNYALPRFQLQLAIIYLLTQSLHLFFRRFCLPRLVPEILCVVSRELVLLNVVCCGSFKAGIILGPTCLGKAFPNAINTLFPPEGDVFLEIGARIGYIFFMFLIGVKMDPVMVLKTGKKAWTIGLVSVLGRLALASALISDLISTVVATVISNMRLAFEGGMEFPIGMQSFGLTMSLILIIVYFVRPGFVWIIKQTPEGKPVKGGFVVLIASIVMMFAIISDNFGLQYHFGPFIVGLSVPVGLPLGSTLVDKLETLVSGLLAPLLLTMCGLKVDMFKVYDKKFLGLIWGIFIVSAMIKTVTTFVPAIMCKVPFKDALALAALMNAQGIVEMASYLKNFINQTIDSETFASAIASVVVMAVTATIVERSLYDYSRTYTGYQKRTITHTPHNSELRILVCTNRQDDALAALKLLEASNPTKDNPIATYGLNLVELLGRATPLLINHGLGQKGSTAYRSQQIIDVFNYYKQQHPDSVSVQTFTAMSLPKFMHLDVCSLAFDKLSSFIILPFHRKWNYQGQNIFDSTILRMINRNVLEMAPCSVGILIDRRKICRSTAVPTTAPASVSMRGPVYRVALLFLGGDDDREALAYAKRMAESSQVHLTVVRLIPMDDQDDDQWEYILNAENLKDLRIKSVEEGSNVVYREEGVKDGSETASIVRSMEEVFDLIMVGRRHREDSPVLTGLSEWMELPELSPLGDVLGAADIDKPVSVLVVQQQLMQYNPLKHERLENDVGMAMEEKIGDSWSITWHSIVVKEKGMKSKR
ncbi:hypothetical protein LguiA_017177 [Lonicera macranthoides]